MRPFALVEAKCGDRYAEDVGGFTDTEQCVHRRLSVGCCVDRTLEPGIWQNLYLRLTDIMPARESLIYLSIGGYAVGFFAELGKYRFWVSSRRRNSDIRYQISEFRTCWSPVRVPAPVLRSSSAEQPPSDDRSRVDTAKDRRREPSRVPSTGPYRDQRWLCQDPAYTGGGLQEGMLPRFIAVSTRDR